ncbi:hypothetical protein [Sporosarcina sp. YIM B06819]|uniref:hypothetical protein n=1 Tax=Sporosarcina sp. YIM B06819 TaxID=3081769 RepID=UPI00298CCEB0|nr:hypothetical protein [Sporosarcina sp. YIM B06819]
MVNLYMNTIKAGVPLSNIAEIAVHLKSDGTPNIDMTLRYIKPREEDKAGPTEMIGWDLSVIWGIFQMRPLKVLLLLMVVPQQE